ncbi:glycosyltransferase family 39 protein [Streptomyces sp. NPDC004959]|uniref:ArnT family glycosyltransferase n=4 Tax=unclassified Streptomyces TaxID=2593676 RepID=UPI0033B32081
MMTDTGTRDGTGAKGPAAGTEREAAADTAVRPVHPFDRRALLVAGLVLAVLLALSSRYGFHRDELYFLDSARHLQASYVDQPVLAPLLARLSLTLFGTSVVGLRLWAALATAVTVLVGALTAREFGGERRAQLLAAVATATMPVLLSSGHIANSTSYTLLAWSATALVVVRIGRTGDTRWWLLAGALAGIGAEFNHLVGIFALALLATALATPARALLANRWFAGGVLLAVLLVLPDVWWQAHHDWATVEMTGALRSEHGGAGHVPAWVVGQFGMTCLAMVPLWLAGLRLLWRAGVPLWRCLALSYGLLFVVFAVTAGEQTYYLAGLYVCLLGAGAVALDGWLRERRQRWRSFVGATAVTAAASALTVLPVLPASAGAWTYGMNAASGETTGWPEMVRTVSGVWHGLPADERAHAVVYTMDYSEAGAVDTLGGSEGLPHAVSAHNTMWWWGPGDPAARTVVVVAPNPAYAPHYASTLRKRFAHVRLAATLRNPDGIPTIEDGGHVWVCTGPRHAWGATWQRLRHYE